MSDVTCTLLSLHVHPVKSCAGIALQEAELDDTGLAHDRVFMVVDEHGEMLTQRECPKLALVQPTFKGGDVVLRAPGMLALHLRLDTVEAATRVQVWDDVVKAYDMGALAAQWFSDCLSRPLRLARFDPEQQRLSDTTWTAGLAAENAFSDGYPLLVANAASLRDLNARLAARGQPAVGMERFRPNLVLEGLEAWDEDHLDEQHVDTASGPVQLRLVKPCVRCSIPNVDPATAERSNEPGATLAGFRADARMKGGITFGMNAVRVQGLGCRLRAGQVVTARWRFDDDAAQQAPGR